MTIGIRTSLAKKNETLSTLLDRRLRNSTKGLGYWAAHNVERRIARINAHVSFKDLNK